MCRKGAKFLQRDRGKGGIGEQGNYGRKSFSPELLFMEKGEMLGESQELLSIIRLPAPRIALLPPSHFPHLSQNVNIPHY